MDGELGLMKSDDQGRTRGICMLDFTWVTYSLSLAEPVLCEGKEVKLGFCFNCEGFSSSIKRVNSHGLIRIRSKQ